MVGFVPLFRFYREKSIIFITINLNKTYYYMIKRLNQFTTSIDGKTAVAYSLIRMFLGIALSIRGWIMLSHPESILELGVDHSEFVWVSLIGIAHLLVSLIGAAHLLGGGFLAFGFLTRLGAAMQIPILFSAIFFVYQGSPLMMEGQSLELAVLVFFLLCIYFAFGAGPMSIRDKYFKKEE